MVIVEKKPPDSLAMEASLLLERLECKPMIQDHPFGSLFALNVHGHLHIVLCLWKIK